MANPRTGKERTAFSLLARHPGGSALRLLHEGRRDIVYGDGGWRLAHLTIKVVLRTDGPHPPVITVKIKPAETVSFPRQRYQMRVMELLRRNEMLHGREPGRSALAAA